MQPFMHDDCNENTVRMLTLAELSEKLQSLDEVMLLELLEINSEMLVNAFQDVVEDRMDKLIKEISFE